ncbi:MAG: alpha/beta hydrolase, partial [Woeseiaceae bacterium]
MRGIIAGRFSLAALLFALVAWSASAAGNNIDRSAASTVAESRFAEVGDLQLEYFQFGDDGTPLVFVQDHHDYFRLEEAQEWAEFLARFSDEFRVVAPVRRGWGRSDDPGYGYGIETQARDILGLLDALGIERAIFAGRTMATQEMLW